MVETLEELQRDLDNINEKISNIITKQLSEANSYDGTGRSYDQNELDELTELQNQQSILSKKIEMEKARLAAEKEKARLAAEAEEARLKAEKEAEAEATRLKAAKEAEEAEEARKARVREMESMVDTTVEKIIQNITNTTNENKFNSDDPDIKSKVENHVMELANQ